MNKIYNAKHLFLILQLIGILIWKIAFFGALEGMHQQNSPSSSSAVILVHGAFQGGWVWDRILPKMKPYRVFCPTLRAPRENNSESHTNIGLIDHINDVCDVIDKNNLSEIILVGHSYGGIVISGVAKLRTEKIDKLVYLDAPIPEDNQSLLDVLGPEAAEVFYSLAYQKNGEWLVPSFPPAAFGLIEEADIQWASLRHTAQHLKTFTDPVSVLEKNNIPTVYVQCLPGNSFTDQQGISAKVKEWQIVQIYSGHCPMITHPDLLAELFHSQIFNTPVAN